MSQKIKYIGPTQTFTAASLNTQEFSFKSIDVKKDELYDIDIVSDGQVVMINGQQFLTPDSTIWIIFEKEECRVPYNPELVGNHWEGLNF